MSELLIHGYICFSHKEYHHSFHAPLLELFYSDFLEAQARKKRKKNTRRKRARKIVVRSWDVVGRTSIKNNNNNK